MASVPPCALRSGLEVGVGDLGSDVGDGDDLDDAPLVGAPGCSRRSGGRVEAEPGLAAEGRPRLDRRSASSKHPGSPPRRPRTRASRPRPASAGAATSRATSSVVGRPRRARRGCRAPRCRRSRRAGARRACADRPGRRRRRAGGGAAAAGRWARTSSEPIDGAGDVAAPLEGAGADEGGRARRAPTRRRSSSAAGAVVGAVAGPDVGVARGDGGDDEGGGVARRPATHPITMPRRARIAADGTRCSPAWRTTTWPWP